MSEHETVINISRENVDFFARIVEAVPNSWSDVSGILEPDLAKAGIADFSAVEKNTGYAYTRFEHGVVLASLNDRDERLPGGYNPAAILIEGKLPGFIRFSDTGYGAGHKFPMAKKLAAGFIRKGYLGTLTFNNGVNREYAHHYGAHLELYMTPWERFVGVGEPRQPMPPSAVLGWSPRYGGCPELLEPILAVCRLAKNT